MKPMLKIRIKFFLRNKCMLIWTYLLIPIIAFIFSIFYLCINKNIYLYNLEQKEIKGFPLHEDYLFHNRSYNRLEEIFRQSIFLVNNETDYNSLPTFISYLKGINVNCYMNKKDIDKPYSLLFELINKKGKYKIKFSQKNFYRLFDLYSEDFQDSTDLFYFKEPYRYNSYSYYYNSYYNDIYYYNRNYFYFLELQSFFSKYLIYKEKQIMPNIDLKINLGVNSYSCYTNFDNFNEDGIKGMCLSSIIAFLLSIYAYFFNLEMINEKEKKLDDYLERKGLSKKQYFISWFLIYLIVLSIPIIAILFLSYMTLIAPRYYLLFTLNFILFIFDLFSVLLFFYILIPNKKYGFTIIKFYNFISPILGLAIFYIDYSKAGNVIFSFIPQINFMICSKTIFRLQTFPHASWEKIWLKANKMSYMECIIMYIIDFIIYFGIFIFFFLYQQSNLDFISFIKSLKTIFKKNQIEEENKEDNNNNLNHLKIDNITKTYEQINAVNNFTLDLYSNEIFCLLGENGSGKSTLLNIISGNIKPDKGDIKYNGKSLIKDKLYFNQNIYFCQQENLCYDYLTVKENLEYLSEIKNKIVDKKKIEELINKVKLSEQINCLYCYLSEGEKRKLNIALSLLDDSNIILIDDPTNSIDIISKTELWDLIKENKKDKIILITTHSFYEAKYLGDKIGIIYNGNLECLGTDSDLSSKYNTEKNNIYINIFIRSNSTPTGYKNEEILNKIKENTNLELGFKEINSKLFSIIIKPDIIEKDKDKEIGNQNPKIYNIFEYLKLKMEEFGIEDYTITSVPLENYFEKIMENYRSFEDENIEEKIENKEKIANFGKQIKLQLKRIFLSMYRNKIIICLIELLLILISTYSFIFIITNIIYNKIQKKLNLLSVLKENPIYIYENEKNYLKKSYAYDLSKSITFKRIKETPTIIEHFIYLAEQNSWANIAKGSISINGKKVENGVYFVDAYNTYIYNGLNGYLFGNTFLIVSSFLKNEYNIEASIFTEIEEEDKKSESQGLTNLKVSIFIYFFELFIFFDGIICDKIKERKAYIKRYLYLKGISLWSYWISFFIIDFTKLIIISLLLILPIYYINIITNFILANIFITDISLLIFFYFISCFFPKNEDSGTKFLFILALISILITILLISIANIINDDGFIKYSYKVFEKTFNFTIFDITPISSMIFYFLRILCFNYDDAKYYLFTSYITQFVNIIFYGVLLILLEGGYFNRFYLYLRNKQIKEDNSKIINILQAEKDNPNIDIGNTSVRGIKNEKPCILNQPNNIINQNRVIEIKGLSKIFYLTCFETKHKFNYFEINDDIYLIENEKLGILGNNGSGRTMIFKSIINDISYDEGSINLFGYDNRKDFDKIKNKICYCPQINVEFDSMKVREIIQFFLDLKLKAQEVSVELLCKKFCLQNYLEIYYNNLSFGNKRKLNLLISLIDYPELLLLDDPFNSVDDISKKIIIRYLKKLFNENNYNCNILISANSIEEINELCNANKFLNYEENNPVNKNKEDKYKLLIIFNDSLIIQNEEISNQKIQEALTKISSNVEGFDKYKNYFMNNSRLEPCLNKLADIINIIIENIKHIKLYKFENNLSYEFDIKFIQKEIAYTKLINIKNDESNQISELNV